MGTNHGGVSLVQQLQTEALNPEMAPEDLLRKAKVVAVKLDLSDRQAWIESELSGYADNKVPPYRILQGQLHALNPARGWVPLSSRDRNDAGMRDVPIQISIGEISHLLKESDGESALAMQLGSTIVSYGDALRERTPYRVHFGPSAFAQILDAVRNDILDWSLKLEKAGITGAGLSFSQSERELAHSPRVYVKVNNIENFAGVMGEVSGQATIKGGNKNETTGIAPTEARELLAQILKHSGDLSVTAEQREALNIEVDELRHELEAPRPKASRLKSGFECVKRILESAVSGASTDIVKTGIMAAITALLQRHA
jgi:hypothetical protein